MEVHAGRAENLMADAADISVGIAQLNPAIGTFLADRF
jgi:hypothetical protein